MTHLLIIFRHDYEHLYELEETIQDTHRWVCRKTKTMILLTNITKDVARLSVIVLWSTCAVFCGETLKSSHFRSIFPQWNRSFLYDKDIQPAVEHVGQFLDLSNWEQFPTPSHYLLVTGHINHYWTLTKLAISSHPYRLSQFEIRVLTL